MNKYNKTLDTDAGLIRLREALERIANLDPSYDSTEGFNEWGEADCFNQAQQIASEALKIQNTESGDSN